MDYNGLVFGRVVEGQLVLLHANFNLEGVLVHDVLLWFLEGELCLAHRSQLLV